MKKIILASFFGFTSLFGIGIGNYQISPEFGANLALQDSGKGTFSYGGYARVWLGVSRIVIAPAFKYDVITKENNLSTAYKNMQIGGLVGFEIPIIPLTPYVGASYSTFFGAYDDTASFNYGIKFKIPIIRVTLGIDGTYQRPKNINGDRVNMNRIGASIGFQF
ncbi:hypothetical protein [Helicobacter cappadocius]|uniref:Uncharacterized protein n=1 Tax=Helicobacter cappadocius TaxID=3063998 RepID=A0AA90TC12_9HELI|nr:MULTISPECIES: hypothetical protein [unclassified Helicobacter]MDO7253375.1 hypothetical protein [Helicobacter sp. faydin-H75]MDP2539361.1 hypothetical protein [Helicobacter sp. faydin-H76]